MPTLPPSAPPSRSPSDFPRRSSQERFAVRYPAWPGAYVLSAARCCHNRTFPGSFILVRNSLHDLLPKHTVTGRVHLLPRQGSSPGTRQTGTHFMEATQNKQFDAGVAIVSGDRLWANSGSAPAIATARRSCCRASLRSPEARCRCARATSRPERSTSPARAEMRVPWPRRGSRPQAREAPLCADSG